MNRSLDVRKNPAALLLILTAGAFGERDHLSRSTLPGPRPTNGAT